MGKASNSQVIRRAIADAPPELSPLGLFVEALDLVMSRHHFLPGCEPCVDAAKRAEREYGIAVGNARAAAEPEPVFDMPPIQQAVTQQAGRWVCFAHYEPADVPQP